MIRRLLSSLVLLCALSGLARAVPAADGSQGPYYFPSNKPKSKRVAVVMMDRNALVGANGVNSMKRSFEFNVEPLLAQLELQGCDVHRYTTTWFERWGGSSLAARRELWNDIGSYYSLVIVAYPFANIFSNSDNGTYGNTWRYMCADSTNGQLLIVGGADAGAGIGWSDTTARGMVDWAVLSYQLHNLTTNTYAQPRYVTYSPSLATNSASASAGTPRDTIYLHKVSLGKRMHVLAAGIDTVFRLLDPYAGPVNSAAAGKINQFQAWVNPYDSTTWRVPGVNDSVARSTVVDSSGTGLWKDDNLGFMWKVRFHLASQNLPNSLGASAPRDVYWYKVAPGISSQDVYPDLLWGLACRFVNADPIRYAYENDDMADAAANVDVARQSYTGGSKTGSTAADSTIARLASYGIRMFTAPLNPHHAYQYATAGESPWYESQWPTTLNRVSYWKDYRLAWIFHAHDTTSWVMSDSSFCKLDLTSGPVSLFAAGYGHAPISLSGNLVGRYGGYTAGNGHGNAAYINQGGAVEVISSDRVASRWNPFGVKGTSLPDSTQILGTRSADSFRAGLVQRMAYSDSMRRIVCPQCEVPPYLNFPANVVLPINWRKSRPAWAGNAAALEYKTGSVDSTICPIDSLLWALDWVLNKGQTYGTGTLYLRTVLDDPKSLWIANDRDSFPASHPYLYPREPWTTRIGGRLIQTYAINSFLVGASADSVKFVNARDVCRLLGFFTPVIHAEYGNTFVGESYGQDVNGNTLGGTIKSGALRNLGPRYADRVAYQHGFSGGYPINGRGNYDVEGFIVALAQQIRALSTLAGRAATRCVAPWQVYGHD